MRSDLVIGGEKIVAPNISVFPDSVPRAGWESSTERDSSRPAELVVSPLSPQDCGQCGYLDIGLWS